MLFRSNCPLDHIILCEECLCPPSHWYLAAFFHGDVASFPSKSEETPVYTVGAILSHRELSNNFKTPLCDATTPYILQRPQVHTANTHQTILCHTNLFDGEKLSILHVSENFAYFEILQVSNSESGVIEQLGTPTMVYLETFDPIGKTISTIGDMVVLEITRKLNLTGNCAVLFTARDITVVTTTECAPFTHAIHLSDLRNLMTNVDIRHCNQMAMTIKECQYIYFISIQVSFDNATYHKDIKTFTIRCRSQSTPAQRFGRMGRPPSTTSQLLRQTMQLLKQTSLEILTKLVHNSSSPS